MHRFATIKLIYGCLIMGVLFYSFAGCGKSEESLENSSTTSTVTSHGGVTGMQPQATPMQMRRATPGMMPPETGGLAPQAPPGPIPPGQTRRAFPTLEQADR